MQMMLQSLSCGTSHLIYLQNQIDRSGLPSDVTAVVNLAGENILNPMKR